MGGKQERGCEPKMKEETYGSAEVGATTHDVNYLWKMVPPRLLFSYLVAPRTRYTNMTSLTGMPDCQTIIMIFVNDEMRY